MNVLITGCLVSGEIRLLADIPRDWLSVFEQKIIEWITHFTVAYKKPPSLDRLKKEFPDFFYTLPGSDFVLEDLFDQAIRNRREKLVLARVDEIASALRSGEDEFPLEEAISDLGSLMIDSKGAVIRYSTFDRRELYFRKRGVPIGLRLIDRVTGGLTNGDYMLIAGRLGTGKTFLGIWLAYQFWQAGKKVLFVSKEMLPADIFARLDGFVGGFDPLLIRRHEIEDSKLAVIEALVKGHDGEVYIPHRMIRTVPQMSEIARQVSADIVILDGVYLMTSGTRFSARWERVADVSNQLKDAALDLGIPIVGVTQIKRVGGKEEYDAEDLAYSDALGQDADFVLALRALDKEGRIEAQLLKNRFGSPISTIFKLDYETMHVFDESVEGRVS